MLRRRLPALLLAAGLLAAVAGCRGSAPAGEITDRYGNCTIKAGAVCRNQDLSGLNLASANLRGADLTGAHLARADLTRADLTDAILVGADLSGTDLSLARLTNANLSKATMFYTIMTDAEITGTNFSDVEFCGVLLPNGALEDSGCRLTSTTTRVPFTSPPSIVTFAPAEPVVCLNDLSGTGVMMRFEVQNATSININLDDLKVLGSFEQKATVRVPFVCDGKSHVLQLQALGSVPPPASASVTLSLTPGEPPKPPGAALTGG